MTTCTETTSPRRRVVALTGCWKTRAVYVRFKEDVIARLPRGDFSMRVALPEAGR